MPNQPKTPNRIVRVEDELWQAADEACKVLRTTRAEVMREALRKAVKKAAARGQSCPT